MVARAAVFIIPILVGCASEGSGAANRQPSGPIEGHYEATESRSGNLRVRKVQ